MESQRVKHRQQPKWISPVIIEAIKSRDRHKSINNETQYRIWRDKVVMLIKQSKKHNIRL